MTNASNEADRRARNLRTPGVVVERHVGVGNMPSWVSVTLDKSPTMTVRQWVPPGLRMPLVGEHVMLVHTKAGHFYTIEPLRP